MKPFALSLLLLGCSHVSLSPEVTCVTPCGMIGVVKDCRALKAAETKIIAELDEVPGLEGACSSLPGWIVATHEPEEDPACRSVRGFLVDATTCVYGYTWTKYGVVEVRDEAWEANALAHELVHAIAFTREGVTGHCLWALPELREALARLSSEAETTGPEASCAEP